jgi:predicted RNase H-like HicB family nuclease
MKLKVIIEKGEDGYFVAQCPSLKSCWSQGKTEEEALKNIREAIELYLELDEYLVENDTHKIYEVAV